MDFGLAGREDLPQLKAVYRKIVENMNKENILIWDEVYPCEFLEEDIQNNRLYVLKDQNKIAAAFALCGSNGGSESVKWENNYAKAVYMERFGVNVEYLRKGVGSQMLIKAAELAREQGAGYLRLLVVDINKPAIALYVKNGFAMADGIYDDVIDADLVLHELGFEINVLK